MHKLDEQRALYEEIGQGLINSAGEAWSMIVLLFRSVGSISEATVTITEPSGAVRALNRPPSAAFVAMLKLRKSMASADKGAWLSAVVTVTADQGGGPDLHASFNYDDKPEWDIEPLDSAYVDDLRRYPRTAVGVPSWYPAADH